MSTENSKQKTVFPYTDLGNAKRWSHLFKENYKWIYELRHWYRWNGSRWELDISGSHTHRIDEVLEDIDRDMAYFKELLQTQQISEDDYEELCKDNRKWYIASQSAGKIHSAVRLASTQPGVSRTFTDFDNKGKYLGVDNGVINLETGELIVDKPEYLITKSCSAAFNAEAVCTNWINFLSEIFEGSQEKIDFIQRLFGQGLLGTKGKDKLVIMCGNGANGKSTLTDTMVDLLGSYALNTSANTVIQSKTNKDYYLAELKGVRLSIINESKKGAYLDEELVKSLVDSGEIQARQIYQAPITFQPVATPILTTNYRPRISADYSISRRIIFVPFDYQFPKAKQNPRFRDEVLKPEMSGILNWVLDGCRQFQEQGLNPPACITDATREYFRENDRIGRFIEERMKVSATSRVKLQDVKEAYVIWAGLNGFREVSTDRVSQEIRLKGYLVEKRNNGVYYVLGLRLKTDDEKHEHLLRFAGKVA
jgi:putative DNA primase/helicase